LRFIIFFNLSFMRLTYNHVLNREFNKLTQLTRFFFSFPSWLFFLLNFIIQHWIDWELSFMICFGLLSMRLSISHDSGHGFGGLTMVISSRFLYLFFFNFIFLNQVDWELIFIIYFNLFFMGLSWSHDPRSKFGR
jgi:hypothetical protein